MFYPCILTLASSLCYGISSTCLAISLFFKGVAGRTMRAQTHCSCYLLRSPSYEVWGPPIQWSAPRRGVYRRISLYFVSTVSVAAAGEVEIE